MGQHVHSTWCQTPSYCGLSSSSKRVSRTVTQTPEGSTQGEARRQQLVQAAPLGVVKSSLYSERRPANITGRVIVQTSAHTAR